MDRKLLLHGVLGGLLAGSLIGVFEIVAALLFARDIWLPFRMVSAMTLGPQALTPEHPLGPIILTGLAIHIVLSAIFGIAFEALLYLLPVVSSSSSSTNIAASLFGLLLWWVNFYLIAPLFSWLWFPLNANMLVQFVAHAFVFGLALGTYLNAAHRTAFSVTKWYGRVAHH